VEHADDRPRETLSEPVRPVLVVPAPSVPRTLEYALRASSRLDISRPSTWRVLLALLAIESARTAADTRVATLADCTGLSPRAVKSAIAELRALGLVRRVGGRCGRLSLVASRFSASGISQVSTARIKGPGSPGGADSSPHLRGDDSTGTVCHGGFTPRQVRAIGACVTRMSGLTGCDAWDILLPDETATLLGLGSPVTIAQAYAALRSDLTPTSGSRRRAFVGAVIELSISESILGTLLT
jgi:hypothetical protein